MPGWLKKVGFFCALSFLIFAVLYTSGVANVPTQRQLRPMTGVVTAVHEPCRSDFVPRCVLIDVTVDGASYRLKSEDHSLLRDLKAGEKVAMGVYIYRSTHELWSVQTSSGLRRTFEDTLALRRDKLDRLKRLWITVGVLLLLYAAFVFLRPSRDRAVD